MLELTNLIHGAILNHNFGTETEHGLTIEAQGLARSSDKVTVNGVPARREGEFFAAPVELTQKFNDVVVRATGDRGTRETKINVVWDKKSFKRVNFFIDDNVFFLSEIARDRPQSLFDHFYLKMLKEFHEKYGLKVTLNLFFKNDHFPFTMDQFPDCYKKEWQANADWLRLAFHAASEFPDRPYQNAPQGKVAADYDKMQKEVERFAGPGVFYPPLVIHWAMTQPHSVAELRERGVRMLCGGFMDCQTFIGESVGDVPVADIGFFQSNENAEYLRDRRIRYDARHQLVFMSNVICCNLTPLEQVKAMVQAGCNERGVETVSLMTHEQYFYPFYQNYLPDHAARMELAIRTAVENGFQFVFFNDGLIGNTAW